MENSTKVFYDESYENEITAWINTQNQIFITINNSDSICLNKDTVIALAKYLEEKADNLIDEESPW